MTKLFPITALFCCSCGLFTPVAKSPCDGLYCLGVEVAQVPGTALICYQTEAERSAAAERMAAKGCQLGPDSEQRQRAVCPRGVTP